MTTCYYLQLSQYFLEEDFFHDIQNMWCNCLDRLDDKEKAMQTKDTRNIHEFWHDTKVQKYSAFWTWEGPGHILYVLVWLLSSHQYQKRLQDK